MSRRSFLDLENGCGCVPVVVEEPEPGEGDLFYRSGGRRICFQQDPCFVVVPPTVEMDEYSALHWYGAHEDGPIMDRQFKFPVLTVGFQPPMKPYEIVFIGPLGEWDDRDQAARAAERIGGLSQYVAGWRFLDDARDIRFEQLASTTDMMVARGVITPARYPPRDR